MIETPEQYLTDTPVTKKKVMKLAWPVVINNLLQSLAITVDLIMVGQLGGVALAGVGLGGQGTFLCIAVIMAASTGTIAMVSRYTGAKDPATVKKSFAQSIILGFFLTLPVLIVGLFFAENFIWLFGAEADVSVKAVDYIRIVFLAAPCLGFNFIANAFYVGRGDTRTPMKINILINLSNVLLNYIFIFGKFGAPALGVRGAAIGTAQAYFIGTLAYLNILNFKLPGLRPRLRDLKPKLEMMKRIFAIGSHAAFEQLAVNVGFIMYIILVIRFGTSAQAAHYIGMHIQSLAFMPGLGFSMAASSLTGQYLGAKKPDQAQKSGYESMLMSIFTMGTIGTIIFFTATPIANIFVRDGGEVIELATAFIRILALGMPAIAIHFTIAGSLRGAGDTKSPMYTSILGLFGCRLPLAVFLGFYTPLGIYGVWLAMVSEYYARSFVILSIFRRGKWKKKEV